MGRIVKAVKDRALEEERLRLLTEIGKGGLVEASGNTDSTVAPDEPSFASSSLRLPGSLPNESHLLPPQSNTVSDDTEMPALVSIEMLQHFDVASSISASTTCNIPTSLSSD